MGGEKKNEIYISGERFIEGEAIKNSLNFKLHVRFTLKSSPSVRCAHMKSEDNF